MEARLTRLSQKYRIPDELKNTLNQDAIRNAYQQSQQMALKLKQIRTQLGYQQ